MIDPYEAWARAKFCHKPQSPHSSEAVLPWDERITVLSVHPDAASRDDVARLAAELMEARAEIQRLKEDAEKEVTP